MVPDEMFDDDVHLGGVDPTRAVEHPPKLPCDQSSHPGLQRNHHFSRQTIQSTMAQTQAHHPDGAYVGRLGATLAVPNSVREMGLGYVQQAGFAGHPFSSPDKQHQVAGV